MKVNKTSIDGKKTTLEVKDKIFSAKINEKLINSVYYVTNANLKGESQKQNKKTKL